MNYQPSRQLDMFRGKRQRGIRPPPALEFETHCFVADALRKGGSPGWEWTHFPAGEERSPGAAARLKRMGTKPGWPDFVLISPDARWYLLELKRGPAPLNDAQKAFQASMQARGQPFEIARSGKEAIEILAAWGAIRVKIAA